MAFETKSTRDGTKPVPETIGKGGSDESGSVEIFDMKILEFMRKDTPSKIQKILARSL